MARGVARVVARGLDTERFGCKTGRDEGGAAGGVAGIADVGKVKEVVIRVAEYVA